MMIDWYTQMNFMCKKHFSEISKDPERAALVWLRCIKSARNEAARRNWHQAVIYFGNALDAAQITFAHNPTSDEIKRYIKTASELTYTSRVCSYSIDLERLVEAVKDKIATCLYPANIDLLIKPLTDIAYSPFSETHSMVRSLFEKEHLKNSQNSH